MNMDKIEQSKILLKEFLEKKKSLGTPSVNRILNSELLHFVQDELGYTTIPIVYRIYTKKLNYKEIRYKGGILMRVYRAQRNKKSQIRCPITHSEKQLLKKYNIYYTPYKYTILLK